MQNGSSTRDTQSLSSDSLSRVLIFMALLSIGGALECVKLTALQDPEIWGHLRAGTWILHNKAWPETGIFSQASGLVWRDFQWGFDVCTAVAYRLAGLRSLPAMLLLFRMGLAWITFQLAGGWRNFWPGVALSAIAQYVLFSMGPTSEFLSLLFFSAELLALIEVRECDGVRALFWLPLLFAIWANLDSGFVFGIILYLIFLSSLLAEQLLQTRNQDWLPILPGPVPLRPALVCGAACIVATLLNPNAFHPYASFFENLFGPVNVNLTAYNAMSFRQAQDYLLMLLAMAAFWALGVLRSRDLFCLLLLAAATGLAFRVQREGALLVVTSVAVIGRALIHKENRSVPAGNWRLVLRRLMIAGAALALAILVFVARVPRDEDVLIAKVAQSFPLDAVDFLRGHPQPGPLFNCFQWGGFLTWYLPELPVAIDSRQNLYPEEMEGNYFKAMNAEIPPREFPEMNLARTYLLDKSSTMGEALRGVSGFHVIYEDEMAIVYSHDVKE